MTPQTTLVPGFAWVPKDYTYVPKEPPRTAFQEQQALREERRESMLTALRRGPCTIKLLQEISGLSKSVVQRFVSENKQVKGCRVSAELGPSSCPMHYWIECEDEVK